MDRHFIDAIGVDAAVERAAFRWLIDVNFDGVTVHVFLRRTQRGRFDGPIGTGKAGSIVRGVDRRLRQAATALYGWSRFQKSRPMDLHLKAPVRAVTGLFRHVRPVAPPVQSVDAVIEVDEFVEAAGTPEFGQLTERADARVRELGFVR